MIYNNYQQYFQDQMTTFESFESDLYADAIKKTIDYVFANEVLYEGKDKILDFCCGDGCTSGYLKDVGYWVKAFDGNKKKIDLARKNHPDIFFRVLEVRESLNAYAYQQFDYIYASHCFEHFLDPMAILEGCKKLIKPTGMIVVIIPYPNSECEGHPGSNKLKLNESIESVYTNLEDLFKVQSIELKNFREPELIIKLTIK